MEEITKQNPGEETEELNHVMRSRREKLEQIREMGVNPFPYSYEKTHELKAIHAAFDKLKETKEPVSVAGRLISIRLMGKASFAHIQDEGEKIQVYLKKDIIGEFSWNVFKLLDRGDIIGIKGILFTTKTGENTIEVKELTLLSKNLRPLPAVKEKDDQVWNEWADKEEKYRHRPVDLIVNLHSRDVFLKRSLIVAEIRNILNSKGFIETETPILQPLYGGAAARPFITHHNALDRQLYLRIADELYLKRLIAGGFPRVYEISKDFRNEGIDRLHSPEFTMMECYTAFEDYTFCMNLMEELLPEVAQRVLGTKIVRISDIDINLEPPFDRFTMADLIREKSDIDILNRDRNSLAEEVEALGIEVRPEWGVGKIIDELFSEKIEHDLINPTFVMDYPVELSPLAKRHRSNPGLVERFELFMGGYEIANSFSELNDPDDQRQRFEEQVRLKEAGDEEATPIDENYLQTLEVGMPPTAGLGMGIDRIVMLFTGCTAIRDVILFPILRSR